MPVAIMEALELMLGVTAMEELRIKIDPTGRIEYTRSYGPTIL
ncbi:MAG: hypothetical protein QXL22_04080 [Candidatus Nezhaarchaeales archaeon]